jgi:hypothetical protein
VFVKEYPMDEYVHDEQECIRINGLQYIGCRNHYGEKWHLEYGYKGRARVAIYPSTEAGRASRDAMFKKVVAAFDAKREAAKEEAERRRAICDNTSVVDLGLSALSKIALRELNITTLGDLVKTTEAELLSDKNFGGTSLREIKTMLAQRGLTLAPIGHQLDGGQGEPNAQ